MVGLWARVFRARTLVLESSVRMFERGSSVRVEWRSERVQLAERERRCVISCCIALCVFIGRSPCICETRRDDTAHLPVEAAAFSPVFGAPVYRRVLAFGSARWVHRERARRVPYRARRHVISPHLYSLLTSRVTC